MEAAFGSGDGDDEATAVVARSQASLGQIFEQKYRPWDGELGPRWMRNYAIFRHHVYGVFTGKGHRQYHPMVRLLILIIFLASLLPSLCSSYPHLSGIRVASSRKCGESIGTICGAKF